MQFLWDVHHICNLSRDLNVEIYGKQDECKWNTTVGSAHTTHAEILKYTGNKWW